MKNSWFQRYLLPGFIFQSVIIAGAYGSGKELEAFFLGQGPVGGLLGMFVTMVIFSIVLMVSFEFARRFRLFDYRSFFRVLLGRGWPLYEILYVLLMILVISIVGAAAGDIVRDSFGIPSFLGTAGIMILIALLVFYGTPAIERFLALWSFVLYATYFTFLSWHLVQHGEKSLNWRRSFSARGQSAGSSECSLPWSYSASCSWFHSNSPGDSGFSTTAAFSECCSAVAGRCTKFCMCC